MLDVVRSSNNSMVLMSTFDPFGASIPTPSVKSTPSKSRPVQPDNQYLGTPKSNTPLISSSSIPVSNTPNNDLNSHVVL